MDLQEARDILRETSVGKNLHPKHKELEAQKIGVQAIELVQELRQKGVIDETYHLLGES